MRGQLTVWRNSKAEFRLGTMLGSLFLFCENDVTDEGAAVEAMDFCYFTSGWTMVIFSAENGAEQNN